MIKILKQKIKIENYNMFIKKLKEKTNKNKTAFHSQHIVKSNNITDGYFYLTLTR